MKNPSINEGLTQAQVTSQRALYGSNHFEKSKTAFWKRALKSVSEPMLLLLLACAIIYLFIGDLWSGFVFLGWTTLVLLSSFYRNYRTAHVLAALEQFAQPHSMVIRDGKQQQIKRSEIVVSDCVLLKEGTRIPADGSLISGTYLKVDESMLTGEALAIEKTLSAKELSGGTMVVKGEGIMQVSAVGKAAALGKISGLLESNKNNRLSSLQKSIKAFIAWAFVLALSVAAFIVLIFALTRGSILQAILNGLSTAMAILPEEFPMVLTLFMSLAAWRLAQKNVLTTRIAVLESLGSTTVLCTDKTGTLTQNKMTVSQLIPVTTDQKKELEQTARLATPMFSHDAMEEAIRLQFPLNPTMSNLKIRQNYPMSSSCFAMAYLYEESHLEHQVYCKGAPEAILQLCKTEPSAQQKWLSLLDELAEKGLRLLGFARAVHRQKQAPEQLAGFHFELMGFIGFEDPIRRGVATVVKKLRRAGVRLVMITGDYPVTAKSIARKAGFTEPLTLVNCQTLPLQTTSLANVAIQDTSIFSRILPAQKLELVRLLQQKGEVVAMIGDGINDAPALQVADVGIAMGEKGADVAREAASLVLLKDQFTEIYHAIEMGRQLIGKIQNALLYIIAIHVPIVGLCVLPALFSSLPIFLMPFHIAFLELIIDPACAFAFEQAPADKDVMRKAPIKLNKRLLTKRQMFKSFGYGITIFLGICTSYIYNAYQHQTAAQQRLLCFALLVLSNLILILHTLSRSTSKWEVLKATGWTTRSILLLSLIALFLVLALPSFRLAFGFELPNLRSSLATSLNLIAIAFVLKWLN